MASFKVHHAKAEKAPNDAKGKTLCPACIPLSTQYIRHNIVPTRNTQLTSISNTVVSIRKVGASSGTSSQQQVKVQPLSLDPNGNCRVNIFSNVQQGETMLQYPYSRCYVVESTTPSGQVLQTSGFALSATRVLTSNAHVVNIEQRPGVITVARSYSFTNSDGSINTAFDSEAASTATSWGDDEHEANIGLRYCMLAMHNPLTITDSEGDQVHTTILSVLSINPNPTLQLITRDVPNGNLVTGSATGAPQRITNHNVAEWYVTNLGGWLGRHNSANHWDFLRGSPIFVTEESGPIDGPLVTKAWLVGLVTDEVVASSPCTVNAGLFVDDGAVTRLL
jgi:hypothetical protein